MPNTSRNFSSPQNHEKTCISQCLNVLVIDDEKNIRTALTVCLETEKCRVTAVGTSSTALKACEDDSFDVAFLDLKLGQADGLNLLPDLLNRSPHLLVIIITAYATFETAVKAIKLGAWDYLPKPFTPDQIRHLLNKAEEKIQACRKIANLENQLKETFPEADFETNSLCMRKAMEITRQAASSQAAVMFRGESGTGKSLLARLLHTHSSRANRQFVTVNCPILQENLLASELFGHAKGAFTGAVRDQPGKVEAADGGTLFLDEIGEVPISLQAQLLRFLQEKQYERIGENRVRRADTRIVCATNRNLEEDVKNGRFREDLFFRVNVVEVMIPPLRERREDILSLARRFLEFFAKGLSRPIPEFSKPTEALLLSYSWPGNIRELRNVIERALIVCQNRIIEPQAFPEKIGIPGKITPEIGMDLSLDELERAHIERIMSRVKNLEEAASILGIDSSTLWRKRKKFEI